MEEHGVRLLEIWDEVGATGRARRASQEEYDCQEHAPTTAASQSTQEGNDQMRTVRLTIAVAAATALIPLTASGAFAAPPSNDTADGAIALSLGETVKQDTTKATTGRKDALLNSVCGAPFTNASVWYTYTAEIDRTVILDMSGSNYAGGFMVFGGQPTRKSILTCGPTTLAFDGEAGKTYYIVAFSDTQVNGGHLVLSLEKGPASPSIDVTVDNAGRVFKDGTAQVKGTYSCKNADFAFLDGQLTQIWKRVKITGYFSQDVTAADCDGQEHAWTKVVESDNGLYAEGDATVRIFAAACGAVTCTEVSTGDQPVVLQRGGQHAQIGSAPSQSLSEAHNCTATPLYQASLACRIGALAAR